MSTLKTNTLTGTTSAGVINVTGEGGVETTNLQQGLAKVWSSVLLDDSVEDNLNSTTITDEGTGDFTHNFTNNMSSKDYVTTSMMIRNNDGGFGHGSLYGSDSETDIKNVTSSTRAVYFNVANSKEDPRRGGIVIHGDLAE